MITTLAFRHLVVRKVRSLFLLLGFSIGVGVMVVLLSIGEAMLDQSRDVALVGGGEVTVLPQGIDIEAMRTGGLGGMFFTMERARFLTRQALGGERHRDIVGTVAPAIEGKLLYLCPAQAECRPTAVRAGGEIPSRAAALGTGLDLLEGRWQDAPSDSAYVTPSPQQLYDEMDRFHLPRTAAQASQGVGSCQPQVVVTMDAKNDILGPWDILTQIGNQPAKLLWRRIAHGVGNINRGGSGLNRNTDDLYQKIRVAASSILRAKLHILAKAAGILHHVTHRLQHIIAAHAQFVFHMDVAGCQEGVDARADCSLHCFPCAVNIMLICTRQPGN